MFKHFFKKLNSHKHIAEKAPEVSPSSTSYDELYRAISKTRETVTQKKESILDEKLENGMMNISIPEGVDISERDQVLYIEGTAKDLQKISDELQSMEFMAPGDYSLFGEWKFLVTDGSIMSSRKEKFIALPPDEWLMMGCKFNDAISGYDFNPFTFFSSPFGSYKLPYGIEIFVTDLADEEED